MNEQKGLRSGLLALSLIICLGMIGYAFYGFQVHVHITVKPSNTWENTSQKIPIDVAEKDGNTISTHRTNKTLNDARPISFTHRTNKTLIDARPISDKKNNRYLIYLCDKYRSCGGLGDRQRAIVGVYLLAVVTGRTFGINMSYPCDLKLFYVPNEINWYIKQRDIQNLSWVTLDYMGRNIDAESDFNKMYPSDVVFIKTNADFTHKIKISSRYGHLFPSEFKNSNAPWKFGWNKLIKPSIHMEEHIETFLMRIPKTGDLVCAHVRMRQNPTIPNDGKAINSLASLDAMWRFLKQYEKNASRFFVASDSMEVRKISRKSLGPKQLDTDGLVLHIDRQGGWSEACLGFEIALLEQAVLTRCKILVASTSGFSLRAAMLSNVIEKLFIFMNGTIKGT